MQFCLNFRDGLTCQLLISFIELDEMKASKNHSLLIWTMEDIFNKRYRYRNQFLTFTKLQKTQTEELEKKRRGRF